MTKENIRLNFMVLTCKVLQVVRQMDSHIRECMELKVLQNEVPMLLELVPATNWTMSHKIWLILNE